LEVVQGFEAAAMRKLKDGLTDEMKQQILIDANFAKR